MIYKVHKLVRGCCGNEWLYRDDSVETEEPRTVLPAWTFELGVDAPGTVDDIRESAAKVGVARVFYVSGEYFGAIEVK